MDLQTLVHTMNSVSPLAVIAGLAYIIYLQVKNKGNVKAIQTNHLHDLPEMADDLRDIKTLLHAMNDNIIYIRARINGR